MFDVNEPNDNGVLNKIFSKSPSLVSFNLNVTVAVFPETIDCVTPVTSVNSIDADVKLIHKINTKMLALTKFKILLFIMSFCNYNDL